MTRRKQAAATAVVYLRVSTREQGDGGVGLEAQETKCREHAARLGLPVTSVHVDVQTGKDAVEDRPGLQSAIAAVQAAPGSVLVAYSVSRVARRQRVLWHVLDDRDGLGIPLSSATEPFDTATPMGRAMLGMLAVWSALEADMVAERTRDALQAVKARGTKLGALSMVEKREGGVRVHDAAKADIIRAVQAVRLETGLPLRALAAELRARGIASVTGKAWHPKTLRKALAIEL
jgi:site-specific DNA recombinase